MVLGRSAGPVIMMMTELCRSLNFKLQRDVAHLRRNEEVRMKMMEVVEMVEVVFAHP